MSSNDKRENDGETQKTEPSVETPVEEGLASPVATAAQDDTIPATDTPVVEDAETVDEQPLDENWEDRERLDYVDDDPIYDSPPEPVVDPEPPIYDEPAAREPEPEDPRRSGGGFIPALLGGVLAAAAGFGAATYLGGGWFDREPDPIGLAITQQGTRLAALETRLDEIASTLSAVPADTASTDIAALGDTLGAGLGDVTGKLDALSASLTSMNAAMEKVDQRLGAVEQRPLTESSETAKAAFDNYERELADLRAALDEQKAQNASLTDQLGKATEATEDEIAAAEKRAADLRAQAEAATQRAAIRAAFVDLTDALNRGAPYEDALASLSDVVDVPPALSGHAAEGIATLSDLRSSYPDAARRALDVALKETVPENPVGKFSAFLRSQTGARSLAPKTGTDPDAVLSRAEAALDDGDLAASLTELSELPPAAQTEMADWVTRAQARADAIRAASAFADTLQSN